MSEKETVHDPVVSPGLSQSHLLAFLQLLQIPLVTKTNNKVKYFTEKYWIIIQRCQTAKNLRELTTKCRRAWLNLGPSSPASVARGRLFGSGGAGREGAASWNETGRLTITSRLPSLRGVSLHWLAAAERQLWFFLERAPGTLTSQSCQQQEAAELSGSPGHIPVHQG